MEREDENWEYEDEQDDRETDPADDDTQDDDLPEELKSRLDAETAKIRERLEGEFNQHKTQYSRRFGAARDHLKEMGLDVADDGAVVIRDQQTAMQKLMGIAPQAQAKGEDDPEPDMWSETDKWKAWNRRQAAKEAREQIAPELNEVKQMLARLAQGQDRQVIPAAEVTATEYLTDLGLGQIAEHPDFREAFGKAMASVPREHWDNPLAVQTAAMTVIPALRANGAGQGTRRETQQPHPSDIYRNSAQSTGRTRSTSRAPESQASAEDIQMAELSGMTVQEWQAFATPESGLAYVGRSNGRQQRNGR